MPIWEEFDEDFEKAEAASFQIVKPGVYQVVVEQAMFNQPDWADYPRLQLVCTILHGDFQGSRLFASGDCNPEYIKYLKGMLVKVGFDPPPKPSEIEENLHKMLDRVLEVKVSENIKRPEYPKVYVNRYVRMIHENPSDDEDIPF